MALGNSYPVQLLDADGNPIVPGATAIQFTDGADQPAGASALANWGQAASAHFHGDGDPTGVVTPSGVGDLYVDDTTPALYQASGLTSADWEQVGGGGSQPGASRWLGPCKISAFTVQTLYSGQPFFNADGGYLVFTVNGESTAHVAFDASAADLKAAIEALPSITGTVAVTFPAGGANVTDADTVVVQFDDIEATDFVTTDASALTGEFAPYADPTSIPGDANGNIVIEMFTPTAGDIIEDFAHAVITAFDSGDGLTYTDDPDTPNGNGPVWSNPSSAQGVGGIDIQSADDSFTNFYGDNGADFRQQPSALTALMGAWAANAAAETPTPVIYGNLPNVVKNSVPIYTVIQSVGDATEGEVWIWVKTATPAPLMD